MVDFYDPAFWVPTVIAIAALVVSVLEIRRARQDREVSKAMLDLIKTMREDLKGLRQTPNVGNAEALRRREQTEWNRLRDVVKAAGWVWDRLTEDE